MAKNEEPDNGIGHFDMSREFLKNIYINPITERKEAQPMYLLYRYTIRTFFYETKQTLEIQGRLFGLVGIEVSIIISLVATKFEDFHGIKGDLIQGIFYCLAFIFGGWAIKDFIPWYKTREKRNVNFLVDELANRGILEIKTSTEKAQTAANK
ncbi:MAG: hypothetical protein HQK89_04295 [Nitrospirae bacterium]|nr:hypothetical protein [Nitrospirota bacterium]